MVIQELWKKLKNLVDIDKAISENFAKKEISLNIIKNDQLQIPLLENKIKDQESRILALKKELDFLELEAKSLREKESEKRNILESIQNSKEFKALERELRSLEAKSLETENTLETTWIELEQLKKDLELLKSKTEEKIKQLNESIINQEDFLKQLELDLQKETETRTLALKEIPVEWLTKYEKMKHKVANPIVQAIKETCSACYYPILRQDMSRLKASGVILCRNCYRFLYYDSQEEKNNNTESF
ncbi:MAG: hypothetical protein SZ59_C0001G0120 [candidate division TM6 bacterium GW2011_GWF2_28_16]|nr:MAG: hypothetical protein SZ59_C0001G0120 [candidate division TM6 bacterium GW2011_GWF2_28_16]